MLLLLLLPALNLAHDTVLLTGGFNGGVRDGCELLDSSCTVPSLPFNPATNRSERSDHITAQTEDGLILTCGGESPTGDMDLSCVALDPASGEWTPHSTLDRARSKATALTVPGKGVMILGGFKELTTSVLPAGSTEWQAGPQLLGTEDTSYYAVCSLLLSETSFLLIGGGTVIPGTRVAEYSTKAEAWEEWPALHTSRWGHACARLGDKVIIAGGVSPLFTLLSSTTVLDLTTREQKEVGDMAEARAWFGMATLDQKVIVFGGMGPYRNAWGDIQEWSEEVEGWVTRATALSSFGSIVISTADVCVA